MLVIILMYSVPLIKIKLLTVLSMVFMGLFSRLVLGHSFLLPGAVPHFHETPHKHHFPDSGSRPSLRFMPVIRYAQKRLRNSKDGQNLEEAITLLLHQENYLYFELMGEIVELGDQGFISPFKT